MDICDEISLWFAEGKYVHKALELKQRHAPLTESQQKKYDESKMPEEGKPEHAEVKELQLEEKTVEKKKRRPFEINPDIDVYKRQWYTGAKDGQSVVDAVKSGTEH